MYRWTRKLLALGMSAALCIGCASAAFAQGADDIKPEKDETVYVFADSDGSAQKIIVSDWLKNPNGEDLIEDYSTLSAIENVKGNENCTLDADGNLIWSADGSDIYYRGNADSELPVSLSLRYWLDGEELTAQELAGKSGNVTIRFEYENRAHSLVEVNGQQTEMYVPFAVVTGMILDADTFHNVSVTNGKLIHDGDNILVLGFALPGMQENLGLDAQTLEIPDYVEITADVTDFELGMTLSIATNQPFNLLNLEEVTIEEDTADSVTALTDAIGALMDGSGALYTGLETLLAQIVDLPEGASQLSQGAAGLYSGADTLDAGAAQLEAGASALSGGLETISGNSEALNQGATQVFATLLATATQQLQATGAPVPELTMDNYAETLEGLAAMLSASPETAGSAATVNALKASLDSYNAFYQGLLAYTGGVDSAVTGAGELYGGLSELHTGIGQLKTGAESLSTGLDSLSGSIPALLDGVTQLRDGAKALADGLVQFNAQGIEKLMNWVQGDLEGTLDRVNAMADLSRAYRNYSGIADDMDGQVKFIFRTEEIQAK